MPGELYIKKRAGFSQEIDDMYIEPIIYQPTPEGVIVLCDHYSTKYNIDLRIIDFRDKLDVADNAYKKFEYLAQHRELIKIKEGQSKGFILSHGQYHTIPLVVTKQDNQIHMIAFDSTSGARIKGYFRIANLFPDALFYLNNGTRQADESSCITDAICVTKEALQIKDLIAKLNGKKITKHRVFSATQRSNLKIRSTPKPDNFILFKMPEALLLTAQSSDYVNKADADLDYIIRGGHSLEYYRQMFRIQVSLNYEGAPKLANINSYLFTKAKEHKLLLDKHMALQANLGVKSEENEMQEIAPVKSKKEREIAWSGKSNIQSTNFTKQLLLNSQLFTNLAREAYLKELCSSQYKSKHQQEFDKQFGLTIYTPPRV